MKLLSLGALLVASAATISAQQGTVAAPTVQEDNEITLTGCVIKGDGGYVLSGDQQLKVETTAVTPGTTAAPSLPTGVSDSRAMPPLPGARVLYWLKESDDLKAHAGHQVEVKGKLGKDIDKGLIEVEVEKGMVELDFEFENRKVSVKVPHTTPAAAPVGTTGVVPTEKAKDVPFTVRTVDVKSVKMLAATCGGA
jgi:hypothetical protein